jgi:hypothetical protein
MKKQASKKAPTKQDRVMNFAAKMGFVPANKYTENVRRGIAFLKENRPKLLTKLDLTTLDLASGLSCVLGQGFGAFYRGLEAIGFDDDKAIEYGFNRIGAADPTFNMRRSSHEYSVLTEEWIFQLKHPNAKRIAIV